MSDRDILLVFFPEAAPLLTGRAPERRPDARAAYWQLAKGMGLSARQAQQAWQRQFGRGATGGLV